MSNKKDPENRSKNKCVCGGHNTKNKSRSRRAKQLARLKKQRKVQRWLKIN